MARCGAQVTGIDAGRENIEIAKIHSNLDPATRSIDYVAGNAESFVQEKKEFDGKLEN